MAQEKKCRIVFMGTPDFATLSLQALSRWPRGEIVAVYTQPDRRAGRGHKLTMPAVKKLALELDLPVIQPSSFKDRQAQLQLASLEPDVLAVAAYGLLLPQAVLQIPRLATLNVHASLLPQFRGAAPIQRAIMAGWQPGATTGVSIMEIVPALDAGPVYACESVPIAEHTAGTLHDVLASSGAALLLRVLDQLLDGTAECREQDESRASYAAKITQQDSFIDWNRPVAQVHAHIRALSPRPGARLVFSSVLGPKTSLLLSTPGMPDTKTDLELPDPGSLYRDARDLLVACADGWYRIGCGRLPGSREMPMQDLFNGRLRALLPGPCGTALPLAASCSGDV
jgi:methionyl-tRNA formyltransferase